MTSSSLDWIKQNKLICDKMLICSNITNPGSLKKAAGIRYVVSFCPNNSVSSHRRWRQGWRQCRCAKDSRPLCADLDRRSESRKSSKTKVIQIPKTVKKPKKQNSKNVRKTHINNKKPHFSVRFWWGKADSLFCGKATPVASVHRTLAKSRLSNPRKPKIKKFRPS